MVGKNNQYLKNTKEGTKVETYSIKKFKVGTASVVIGASIFLGAGAVAQAAEEVSNNTTAENTTNAVAKEETPKAVVQPTKVENTKESVAAAVAAKVGAETPKTEEALVKAETKAADKTALKASIDSLEKKLKDSKNADEAVLKTAREELAKAKEVFAKADATQDEVNAKVITLDVLTKTVAESEATTVAAKEEAKKAEDKAKSEQKQTAEVKEAKKELTQVTSEAEVTSVLAKEAIRKNEVKIEAKPVVEKAVAKNEEVIKVANELLGNDGTTKEQIAKSLEELGNSIKAVYSELENAGVRRDGRYGVALSAGEGYTDKTEAKSAENGEFTATSTGKTYEVLDNNDAYRLYVHGYQSENSEIKGKTSPPAAQGGRTDLPLSSEEAKKLSEEAPMWTGKIRPAGSKIGPVTYGSGGAYEFIATEIYGYNYDQGNHYAYIKNVTKRFSLSPEATAAGYSIKNVEVSNLIPGLAYNKNTDSVEGYVLASIQNGVYDFRYDVTVAKPDGTTTKVSIKDLKAGWMGWQDTSAPRVAGNSTVVTVGDTINHDLKFMDNDGFANDTRANYKLNGQPIEPGKKISGKATFTGLDGTELTSMTSFVIPQPHLVVNGEYMPSKKPISNTIPGLTFDPTKNLLEGKASDAGIYTLAVLAKDFNNATNSKNAQWTANGQETHESVTIAVAPKITVKNVEAYAKELDVTISKGANTGEIRMPDGTVTKFAVKDGKWVVTEGTTNSAVTVGTELGTASETADSTFKLAVTSDATKYVGVDNIAAKASTDKVKASLQREVVTVRDKDGNTYTATLNAATGKYAIPDDKAYELVNNGDGTSTLTERRVYTEAAGDGAINYYIYEFKRVWTAESNAATLVERVAEVRKNGKVKQVVSVDKTDNVLPFAQVAGTDGVTVQVTYDSVSQRWTASDGSTVTATKSNAGWILETSSGFRGYVAYREATGTQLASIQNAKPTGTSTSYSENKDATVDLIGSEKADVGFKDKIDDKSDNPVSDTIKTKLTVTAPDGTQKVFDAAQPQEEAYIAAQRTAAEKTKAAAAAVKNEQDSINDLARQQEIVDRETRYVANAEEALTKLKLRTVSPTAQELAEKLLADGRARLEKETAELRRKEAELPGITAQVATTRQEALDSEAAVETARTALKTAAEANLANAKQYALSQVGRYKVTVRDVDSNGVVTTPTVGGTDSGEVTEDAVAETTYYIVVTEPKKSSGVKNTPQSASMEEALKANQPAGTTVSDYKLVDPETGKRSTSVTTNEGTYTVNPTTGEVTFTPNADFVGNASPITVEGNVTFNDEAGNPVKVPVSNTYTPTVYGLDNVDDTTTGKQGQPQKSITGAERFDKLNTTENTPDGTNVDMTTAKYSLTGANPEGKVVVPNEGTYSIDPATGIVTFEPLPTFKGKATGVTVNVTAKATDSSGKELDVTSSATYTPEVEEVVPTATPAKTSGKQGQPQKEDAKKMFHKGDDTAPIDNTTIRLVDPSGAEVTSLPAMKNGKQVGTYTLDPATGIITFQPNPDFDGTPEPVKVTAADKNGTKVTTTYTPTVTPVEPTGTPVTSEGKQGQTQTGKPVFTEGDPTAPITITEDQPAQFIDPTTGEATEATEIPAKDEKGNTVGKYTIDPLTGVVTFTPNKDFTGTPVPATVEVKDKNGTPAKATYTPTVTPVKPTGEDVTSSGKQGQPQEGTPKFTQGDEVAPITINEQQPAKFFDPITKQPIEATEIPAKDGEGNTVGKYTIDPLTGKVTFTPNKDFTGTPVPATVQVKDANGTPTTANYTPTVTPVKPTGEDVTSSGKQGQPQTGKPVFTQGDEVAPITINEQQPAKFFDPVTKQPIEATEIPAKDETGKIVGKYTIDPLTGVVTFTPNKDFTGTPVPATVQVKDANGTPTTANYTPTVTPVVPTKTPKETSGKQAQPQTQDTESMFTKGDEVAPIDKSTVKLIDPETNAEVTSIPAKKDGKQVGTYTLDSATGVITFQPNKDFVGTPDPVKVVAADTNGTKVETTYTPTVTPVKPTSEDVTSTGKQGQPQEGTPKFTQGDETAPITINEEQPAKFVVNGQPVEDKEIPATKDGKEIGKYTIDPTTGKVTFTPNKDFIGTPDPATVEVKDKNGTPTTATYTPTVTPVVPTATPKETTGKQAQPQTQDTETMFTKGDEVAPIDKTTVKLVDPSGNEVTTLPATKDGKEVGTYTLDPETGVITFQPNKDFVGTPDPVKVVAKDTNGTKVETTYTPTVTPVTPTSEPKATTGIQGATQEGTPTFTQGDETAPITITPEQPAQFVVDGKPITETTIPAMKDGKQVGTYTIDPTTGKVTFTPNKDFVGTPDPATVQVKDKNGTPTSATYTPTVTPVTPTAEPAETTDIQGKEQTGKPTFKPGNPEVPMDDEVPATFEDGTKEKVVPGEGTYKVNPDGTVTFTPEKRFTGTAKGVTVKRVDKNGTPVTAKYTPTVTPVTPTAEPAETTDIQGKEQTGKPTFKPGNPEVPMDDEVPATFEDGTTEKIVPGEGAYKVNPDGTVTFTPEKGFTGVGTGVTVKRVDKNGTPVTAKYTPTVTPVTPEGTPAESTGIQGAKQEGTPEFKPGNPNVPIDETVAPTLEGADKDGKVVVPGEGTYTIDKDGKVTFTPEPQFTGVAKGVTVKRVDKNGTPVTAKYTPTVTPVTPEGTPAESTGIQGAKQEGTPEFKPGNPEVPMDDETPATFEDGSTEKVVPGEGTYKVSPDGTVTFTPEKSFTGTAKGVTVKRVDKNGTPVTATYTPTVTPVTPEGTPAESTGLQGIKQEGTPEFKPGNPNVPIDETVAPTLEGADKDGKVVVPGEGTYTIDKDGKVTFTPEPQFVGKAKGVTVKRVDKNGTPVTATYTPTVKPVEPTGKPAKTINKKGETQTGKPTFTPANPNVPIDEKVPATFEDGSTEKVVPGEGKYTVAPDGTVTFVPEKDFVGKAKGVAVRRVDTNGNPITSMYLPVVTPELPEANPAFSVDVQGVTQTGKPTFIPGSPNTPIDETVPATFEDGSTEKVVPGEGTYTVAPDGTVTFVPEKDFVGTAQGVLVVRVDTEGNLAYGVYIPTVLPLTPSSEPEVTKGPKGQVQKGKPTFKPASPDVPIDETRPATFEDGSTTKVVPGEGTYTVAPDGTVTFTPEKDFEGKAKGVTVKRYDKKGTPILASYTPLVTPQTKFVDTKGNVIEGYPAEDGTTPKKDIPGYRFVETKNLPNGDVEHVYEKVTTPAPTPTPVVEKSTTWTDEEGNPLRPPVNGIEVPGEIPGYEFGRTVTDKDGNVRHIFKKTSRIPGENRTTTWTDENGNSLKPSEKGTVEAGKISGYEFIRTVIGEDGNVRHIFRKATNEKLGQRLANTGTTQTNTGLAGLGLAILGGLLSAARRKNDKN
ncbi:YSIRK-type signal peptide-containing protein [Gemella haemolysans]|uniref:YSIRK-type signal peptide-containing protein n=1 Tax=Gemella haemolysans TaxID=1379 RepID=A0AAW6B698_9BACL|nr:YSIRK-type signal peptide-containing protein [Gemella haemolysans]MDB6186454.1 YSIRK-type signal peptide-containing protein [Gemella haemolysans]